MGDYRAEAQKQTILSPAKQWAGMSPLTQETWMMLGWAFLFAQHVRAPSVDNPWLAWYCVLWGSWGWDEPMAEYANTTRFFKPTLPRCLQIGLGSWFVECADAKSTSLFRCVSVEHAIATWLYLAGERLENNAKVYNPF